MPTLIGELEKITGSPSSVTQVMVRAHKTRITGAALTTDELVPIPVDRQGRFEVPLRPGKAVLVLVHGGRVGEGERFPMLVEEGLGTIVSAIKLASDRFDDYELDELERAAADMLASLDKGLVAATRAEVAKEGAENAKKGSEDARDKAGEHRDAAEKAAGSAAAEAADGAVRRADEKLSGYVTNAKKHAGDSAGSATAAGKEADRAETARQGAQTIEANLPTKVQEEIDSQLPAELRDQLPGELASQLPAQLDQRVPQKVAEAIADDRAIIDAAVVATSEVSEEPVKRGNGEMWLTDEITRADFDILRPGTYHISGAFTQGLGIPSTYGGRLVRSWINSTGAAKQDEFSWTENQQLHTIARYHGSRGWGDWVRSPGDAAALERQRIIPSGTDWDTLTQEGLWAAPSSGRNYTNGPVEEPIGKLYVSDVRNSSGNVQSQLFLEHQPSQVWLRFRATSGNWGAWEALAMDGADRMQSGAARRAAVVEAGLKRRGGVVGTGGKPAIALRFDHHLAPFEEKVLPLLKKYRLPWGQMINSGNMGSGNDSWTWEKLAQECHVAGGEVWNHARTHSDVTNAYEADVAVTLGLSELQESLPSVWIDSWAPPGQSEYMGFVNQNSPEKFFDTYPGKLVLTQHAFVRGSYPGSHHPLTGRNLVGQSHITMDAQTAAWCQSAVRSARDTSSGLTFMLHSNYLDEDGYMSASELDEVLGYIAQLRDAGELVVLSNAGILMADSGVAVRQTNMLASAGAGEITSSWSQRVTSRSYRAHLGVPHEAEAWVTGAGPVTLRVEIDSPTYPVTTEHTTTLAEGQPQRLSTLVTPPLDTTGITVALTGSVRHTGIIYRTI